MMSTTTEQSQPEADRIGGLVVGPMFGPNTGVFTTGTTGKLTLSNSRLWRGRKLKSPEELQALKVHLPPEPDWDDE